MRSESMVRPQETQVTRRGEIGEIALREDVREETRGGRPVYVYEEYRVSAPWRETLADAVLSSREAWLQRAKETEAGALAGEIREKRDRLLKESDWTQGTDTPLCEETRAEWKGYRQELRDVPQQEGFPYTVVWPVAPKGESA